MIDFFDISDFFTSFTNTLFTCCNVPLRQNGTVKMDYSQPPYQGEPRNAPTVIVSSNSQK